jgi:hypothetical protein
MNGRALGVAVVLGALLAAARAGAHEVGLSRGEYVIEGAIVRADLALARRELIGLVATLDANGDGALTTDEVEAARGAIEGALVGRVKVKGDGAPCAGTLDRVEPAEQDGVVVRAVYRCARRPAKLAIDLTFMSDLAFGHRHLARVTAGASETDHVLSQRRSSIEVDVPPDAAPAPVTPAPERTPLARRGALDAIARWPTLVFLLALLARASDRRAALAAGASFVIAALSGLVLGARGVFLPSPSAAAIAVSLSLVYAGVDALVARSPSRARFPVAIPFGLVHGLAAAHAFRALAAPPGGLVLFAAGALASLAFAAAALATMLFALRKSPAFQARGVVVLGALAVAAGAASLVIPS